MRRYLFIAFIFICFAGCDQQKVDSSNKQDNVYKREGIQFLKTYSLEYKFGEPDESSKFLIEALEMDTNGKIIKQETYHRSEYMKDYESISYYKYDLNGNLIETKKNDLSGNLKSIIRDEFKGDKNTERLFYTSSGTLEGKVTYKYDVRGNRIELVSYNELGSIEYKSVSSYNNKNEEIKQVEYNEKGDITESSQLVVLDGNRKEYQSFDGSGKMKSRYSYLLNDKDQVLESIWIDIEDSTQSKTINKFNEKGLMIESVIFGNNNEPEEIKRIEWIKFKK